jgi:RNA polymerase sigma factor (sigma-70 family)
MSELPEVLRTLLDENPPSSEAWARFARQYTSLLLHVARSTAHSRDDAMDAYACLLERLSEDGCRRLRAYSADPRSKFTTWLVVVARRICIDHYRVKYGRLRNGDCVERRKRLELRRKIENLDTAVETDLVADDSTSSLATALDRAELAAELANVRAALKPEDRLLISMRFDDEMPASEIAAILQYPSQFHVYRRINAILAELNAELKARGFETPVQ